MNNNFHSFDFNTPFEEVLSWCINNNCFAFSKSPEDGYIIRSPEISYFVLNESLRSSIIRRHNHYFYIINQNLFNNN
jgi:hypothetical protein